MGRLHKEKPQKPEPPTRIVNGVLEREYAYKDRATGEIYVRGWAPNACVFAARCRSNRETKESPAGSPGNIALYVLHTGELVKKVIWNGWVSLNEDQITWFNAEGQSKTEKTTT